MISLVEVSAREYFLCIQCQERYVACRTCAIYVPKFSSRTSGRRKLRRNWLTMEVIVRMCCAWMQFVIMFGCLFAVMSSYCV